MGQIPAVRWHPRLVFAMELAFPLKFIGKDRCGWPHALACVPWVILAGIRVAMEMRGWSKQAQSLISTLHVTYSVVLLSLAMALNDACFGSMGPSMTSSPATAAVFASAVLLFGHLVTPCSMQHLPLVCLITGIGNITHLHLQYLLHNSGSLGFHSWFTSLIGLLAITLSTLASLALAVSLRLHFTGNLMVGFLQSIRFRRGD